jgi:hypothetical protein
LFSSLSPDIRAANDRNQCFISRRFSSRRDGTKPVKLEPDQFKSEKKTKPNAVSKAKGKNPTKKPNIRLKILHRHNKYLKISKSGV